MDVVHFYPGVVSNHAHISNNCPSVTVMAVIVPSIIIVVIIPVIILSLISIQPITVLISRSIIIPKPVPVDFNHLCDCHVALSV